MKWIQKAISLMLVLCLAASCFPAVMAAEEGTGGVIIDGNATEDLVLYGDAKVMEDTEGRFIELTPLETWRSGSVWYSRQIDASSGFSTQFEYWAGGGRDDYYGGADGIVLTFSSSTGLGSDGEYMGFVSGSYGVELDSYPENNGDPAEKHVAIIYNEVSNHLSSVADDRVDDSAWHTLEVEYSTDKVMTVYLDGAQLLTQENVNLPDEIYLGISAATGGGYNRHMIRNFYMTGIVSEGGSLAEDEDPIVVVPGIMGSRLFTSDTVFDDSTLVWDPPHDTVAQVWDIHKLNERMEKNNTLYVRPCENQNDLESGTVAKYGREYGALDTYKNLVDTLCETYPDREVYVFSYDWRKSNAASASKLDDFIDLLEAEKVDIVCHSMGGLVVSSYFKAYGHEGRVDKIITCGTPYEGAPKLLNSVQNWDVLGEGVVGSKDDWTDNALGIWGGMTKELKSSFDGVAELTPTENYVEKMPMWRDSWKLFSRGDYKLNTEEYENICKEVFSPTAYENAQSFQKFLLAENGYNCLLGYEKAYFLIGINQKTITAIKFQYANVDIDEALYESDLNYGTKGDGTVPYLSASIMEQVEKLPSSRWITKSVNHENTVKNEECIDWICDILRYGVSTKPSDILTNKAFVVLRIACPVDVTITCGEETLCSDIENLAQLTSFGRLDILGENNEIKMFCLDASDACKVVMNGTGEGTLDYTIRFFDSDGELQDERSFAGVPLTEDTVITTDIAQKDETVLDVDHNGDGTVDESWKAEKNECVTEDEADQIPLTAITLTADKQVLSVGEQLALTVEMNPADTTDRIYVTYTSSDAEIAAVDENGVVTACAPGTAVILAEASNGMTSELELTVTGEAELTVTRISGKSRVDTSLAIADKVKEVLQADKFGTVVVANAQNFPDALTGSYLAIANKAPILLTMPGAHQKVADYIKANLAENGKVYILGGTGAVSADFADLLAGYDVERLSGKSRYDTNLVILEKAGITDQEILISTGLNFADSLSASAANLPVLMVNGKGTLTDSQKTFLETYKGNKMTIIGGSGAVSEAIKAEIEAIVGHEIGRLSGKSRQETSVKVAETYINAPTSIVLASSMNFPDGLCGGPLAYYLGAPLILTTLNQEAAAAGYVAEHGITAGFVLGGTGAVKDETVQAVFGK